MSSRDTLCVWGRVLSFKKYTLLKIFDNLDGKSSQLTVLFIPNHILKRTSLIVSSVGFDKSVFEPLNPLTRLINIQEPLSVFCNTATHWYDDNLKLLTCINSLLKLKLFGSCGNQTE